MLLGLHELVGNAATPATCTQDRNDLVCAARLYKDDSFRDVLSVSMNVIITRVISLHHHHTVHLLSGPHHGYVEETIHSLIPPTRTFWSFRAKSSSSNMVLTRSRSGESRGEQTQQELSVTAGPGASTPAPESSSARVTDTGSGSTTTTNIDATLKASDTKSRRSTYSKRKRLAELEAIEQLAEMEVKKAQAEQELKEIQLQRLRVEAESSDDEELEDDLASVRIGTWLARPAPPPGGETRPPPHDASGGRISRDAAHAATATYTGAPAGAHPLRDDDGYGKVRESVCAKTKGNIASEVSHGNVSDKLIDVGTLAAALAQVMRSSREPPKYMQRLPVFDGKPGEWIAYKAAYCDSHTYFSSVENIARIRLSLRGAAKEAVECLLFSQSDPQVILDALERRFGRPEALIMTELDKVKLLPRLKDDPRDICIFASRIANTVGTIEALNRIHYLHSPEMSRSIIDKLTPILKHKWYDYAANKKLEDTPVLKLLSMFMNEEADKCSAYALPERDRDNAIDERRRRRVERTFMVNTRQKTSSERCPACKQHGHKLPDCSKYKQLDIDKRWNIAKSNNMCFRCLRSKHRRNMCRAPTCDVKECNMKHHKLLHKERNVNTAPPAPPAMTTHESVTSARETTSPHNRRAYLKIVPVTLSGPHARLHTYALLDDGSTVTLIPASVADILGADGPESSMCIQGLGTEFKHERSRTVSLHIQGKYHSAPQKIEAARTVTRLEVTAQTVHTEDINNCRHLDDIRSTLVYDRARPMILIGQDNWHLLVATKTRTGARDQPVASYTKLGWVLHGCQYTVNKDTSTFCGHITIKENPEPFEETIRNFKPEPTCLEPRIPREDLQQQTLGILEKKSRRLPDRNFKKRKQEAPTMPKSHLGTLKRLDKLI
ncbi:uncharacterized protein LOC126912465 [Spodoptera frugiperda]|uniref:Uncharacterized protein LOC126912465 n=1 Tax=Spodoptera frugiperda TaxID=7108 RepID=A0A9R0E912_SPOFR|nr:uncharacterized protein LOC126912465 [Spodoptera frugiperda]